MIPANRENAESAQQIEITHVIAIIQILALPFLETDIVADGLEHAYELLVQVARMHGTALRLPVHEHLGNI